MKRRAALRFALPVSWVHPRGAGTFCLQSGAACACCSLARGFLPFAPRLASRALPLLPRHIQRWALFPSVPLHQLRLTFWQWHLESSGSCAALPHGPRGLARHHGYCSLEGKNYIFISIPPSPFSLWSFF